MNFSKLAPFIFILSCLVYSNIIKNDFAIDDNLMIKENQFVTKGFSGISNLISKSSLAGYTDNDKNTYRPLTMAFFAIQYEFFKDSPKGYHLISILLYGILCVLILKLLIDIGFTIWPALMGALFFTLHPIHTEVVANIKSQDELLVLLFSVLAILYFLKFSKNLKLSSLTSAAVFTLIALFSKENAVVLMVLIPLLFYFCKVNISKSKLAIALFLPFSVYFFARKIVLGNFIMSADDSWKTPINNALFQTTDSMSRFATEIVLLMRYLKLTFLPFPLSADYSIGAIQLNSITSVSFILSSILLLGIVYFIFRGCKSKSMFTLGLLIFFVSLAPMSNIFIKIAATFGERFLFMPSLGISIVIGALYVFIHEKFKLEKIPIGLFSIIYLFFAVTTYGRNKDWKNDYTIHEAATKVFPNVYKSNAVLAYKNNSKALETIGSDADILKQKASEYNQKAYDTYPFGYEINNSLGLSKQLAGSYEEAIKFYKISLLDTPSKPQDLYDNISQCFYQKGMCDSSKFYIEKMLEFSSPSNYSDLGNCYFEKKEYQKASISFEKAWEKGNKTNSDEATNVAVCYHLINNKSKAKFYYQTAIKLNPANEKAIKNINLL
jgi:protein O-mannosyl-transferase